MKQYKFRIRKWENRRGLLYWTISEKGRWFWRKLWWDFSKTYGNDQFKTKEEAMVAIQTTLRFRKKRKCLEEELFVLNEDGTLLDAKKEED